MAVWALVVVLVCLPAASAPLEEVEAGAPASIVGTYGFGKVSGGLGRLTSKSVRAGSVVWGVPARPLKQYLEQLAALARLPKLRAEVLRDRVEPLERVEVAGVDDEGGALG